MKNEDEKTPEKLSANFSEFLKSKYFFIHLGVILVVIFLFFFITLKSLDLYTSHGEFKIVPNFKGQLTQNLNVFIQDKNLTFEIIDSVYDPKEKYSRVLRQIPDSGTKVKENRKIFLSISTTIPPKIKMPKLIDRSEKQAILIIKTYGLKLGKIEEKLSNCDGCILSQKIKGKEVPAGTIINKGSIISLIKGKKESFYNNTSSDTLNDDGLNLEND